jgi:phosphatidylserine/phosphatidylglycerophosphate/cardiolipin synthase-like enzyme
MDYYHYIVERITKAKTRLYLNMFIVDARLGNDVDLLVRRLIRLLAVARRRGVDVRMILAASRTADIALSNVTTQLLCELHAIPCRITAESQRPSHCKYAILDDEIVIGSHNWEAGAFTNFSEDSVSIRDTRMRQALVRHFRSQWISAQPRRVPTSDADDGLARSAGFVASRLQKPIVRLGWDWLDGGSVRMLRNDQYLTRAKNMIDAAQSSIQLTMFYFSAPPSPKSVSKSKELLIRLLAAMKRGVRVRVILDRDRTSDIYGSRIINQNAYKALLAAKADVVFDDVRKVTHSKVLVVDGMEAIVGSHNWTDASLRHYEEVSANIRSVPVAKYYSRRFDHMYKRAPKNIVVKAPH